MLGIHDGVTLPESSLASLLAQSDPALVLFKHEFFFGHVGAIAKGEQIEVDLVGVEFGAIDAGE
ncbi:MAG TPA: hypothetical protein VK335_23295, partial [Bryobacteraceae bacterium]|nr:hypothetical protein [Bryobacteraceae bacterium]